MLVGVLSRFYFAIYVHKHWVIRGTEYVLGLVAGITGCSLRDGDLIPKHDNTVEGLQQPGLVPLLLRNKAVEGDQGHQSLLLPQRP